MNKRKQSRPSVSPYGDTETVGGGMISTRPLLSPHGEWVVRRLRAGELTVVEAHAELCQGDLDILTAQAARDLQDLRDHQERLMEWYRRSPRWATSRHNPESPNFKGK